MTSQCSAQRVVLFVNEKDGRMRQVLAKEAHMMTVEIVNDLTGNAEVGNYDPNGAPIGAVGWRYDGGDIIECDDWPEAVRTGRAAEACALLAAHVELERRREHGGGK